MSGLINPPSPVFFYGQQSLRYINPGIDFYLNPIEIKDTHGFFSADTFGGVFTPTIPGFYEIFASESFSVQGGATGTYMELNITGPGLFVISSALIDKTAFIHGVYQMNGTTDTLRVGHLFPGAVMGGGSMSTSNTQIFIKKIG